MTTREETFTRFGRCVGMDESGCSVLIFEDAAELVAELTTELVAVMESMDLHSSLIFSNKVPFDRSSIFLLKTST